jgi:ABC-2 type transport system ATP-binding protein/sodium transport system ATP-binding protein
MIHVHNLRKSFESGDRTILAVDDVSFHVSAGEVFGLLGPNGAGKTTTMRMILGLLRADSGYAAIDQYRSDEATDEVKKRVGFVSANAGTYQWLTPREILTFFGDVYGMNLDAIKTRIDTLSRLMGIGPFLDQRSATLSTGQRQRINLARALVHDPPVMLLDEPTLGLDVVGSQIIFDYIQLLCGQDKAIILCTHSLEQAQRVCDRFALLHQGRIVHTGTLQELQRQTGRESLVDMFIDLLRPPQGSLLSAGTEPAANPSGGGA